MKIIKLFITCFFAAFLSTAAVAQPKLDINTASQAQLESLVGIGSRTATAIINYREQYGYYQKIEDLIKVKGIGTKKLIQIQPYIKVLSETDLTKM
ncbi:MAG TPA: competence protein ComEA [Gammaproteobacteria bacterium]|nr:competence protein ComEA [Gammaproteobacteria bacterium]HAU06684.1 competence protein ComEA [Gammaproteobacteria bacterium]